MATSDFAILTVENTGGALALKRKNAAEVVPEAASPVYGSVTGNPAVIPDAAGERVMRSVRVNIEPVQAGSGDPSPDNVRPISGWTGAKVTKAGASMLDGVVMESGYINSTGEKQPSPNLMRTAEPIPATPGRAYAIRCVSASSESLKMRGHEYDASGNWLRQIFVSDAFSAPGVCAVTLTVSGDAAYIAFSVPVYSELTAVWDAADYSVSFPSEAGTVYGGVLDLTAGTLTVTHGYKELGAADVAAVGESASGVKWARSLIRPHQAQTGDAYCDKHVVFRVASQRQSGEMYLNATNYLYYYDNRFTDTATAKQILEAENPVLVYPLAEPVVYQLTPVQIAALAGTNAVFADCGPVSAEYVRDTGAAIEAGDASTRAMIGEASGETASRSLAVGEYVTVGDVLYRVTAAVGQGETLVPGSNVTETTVGAELSRIAAMIS